MARRAKIVLQAAAVSVVALLIALLAIEVASKERARNVGSALAAGKTPVAPNFELRYLDSEGTLRLSSLRGKVVVLNFWASYCLPCKDEAPRLQGIWERYRDRGVVVLGVAAWDDFKSDARGFVERYRITYPQVKDNTGAVFARFGVQFLPETWFIDRKGKLVGERVQGEVSAEQLERNVRLALAQA
jgi:cytochrome c biogenesis protein CcmG/thiol:disulfide interchange protein DsbE